MDAETIAAVVAVLETQRALLKSTQGWERSTLTKAIENVKSLLA